MSSEWIKTIEYSLVSERTSVVVAEKRIALFKISDGSVYALSDICSHEYALLSEGDLVEDEIWCPKHGSHFNVRSGEVTGFPATIGVPSYPVKIEDGWVWVKVDNHGT